MIPKEIADNPEFQEALKSHEKQKVYVRNQRRLLNLAKQAPFAAANEDFLALMESKIEHQEQKIEMMDFVLVKMNEGESP